MTAWTCPECAADPTTATNRSCAPRRCYCLHDSCHAAGSREARTESVADVVYPSGRQGVRVPRLHRARDRDPGR